jgi:hypothetical protein
VLEPPRFLATPSENGKHGQNYTNWTTIIWRIYEQIVRDVQGENKVEIIQLLLGYCRAGDMKGLLDGYTNEITPSHLSNNLFLESDLWTAFYCTTFSFSVWIETEYLKTAY